VGVRVSDSIFSNWSTYSATTAENLKRQRQERCRFETANTCTQKLRTRRGHVFAVLPALCGDWGLMGLVGEASPVKWGRLHNYSELRCCARRRSTPIWPVGCRMGEHRVSFILYALQSVPINRESADGARLGTGNCRPAHQPGGIPPVQKSCLC